MNSNSDLSRRRFIATATTGTGATLLPGISMLRAAPDGVGETEHFWYRLAPAEGPYIDSQRDNLAFGIGDGVILLSENNAKTWPYQAEFPDAENINFSCILGNGNIVFATRTELYLSTDRLKTLREITVKDRDGSDYTPHTPKDPENAGWYFYSLDGVNSFEVDGNEMLIWGNYCNVKTGPVPANIYFSTDGGETVKIAYSFGQNPQFQYEDSGPESWLGDPDNPVICRHIHSVSYNPDENAFYACSGDIDRGHGNECHWLRGTYDSGDDSWDWKVQVSANANSRYKSGGINFVDGQIYWVADANGPKTLRETYDRGIFRCDPADLAHPDNHTKIFDAQYELAIMTIEGDTILVPEYGNASPCDTGFIISTDRGKTWGQYDLKEFGDRSGVRVNQRNSDGWFRVGLRQKWLDRAEVLFIKPKPVK
tara:strand:+ start:2554 stop:3828 length:1275 start_codon:yes stop_codon:yes gene_type:complete